MQPSRNVRPLPLPGKRRARPAEGTLCSTAGWGMTHQGGRPACALQELDLRVQDTRMCNNSRFWNGTLVDSMLCLKAVARSQAPCKVTGMSPLEPKLAYNTHPLGSGRGINIHLTSKGVNGQCLDWKWEPRIAVWTLAY